MARKRVHKARAARARVSSHDEGLHESLVLGHPDVLLIHEPRGESRGGIHEHVGNGTSIVRYTAHACQRDETSASVNESMLRLGRRTRTSWLHQVCPSKRRNISSERDS